MYGLRQLMASSLNKSQSQKERNKNLGQDTGFKKSLNTLYKVIASFSLNFLMVKFEFCAINGESDIYVLYIYSYIHYVSSLGKPSQTYHTRMGPLVTLLSNTVYFFLNTYHSWNHFLVYSSLSFPLTVMSKYILFPHHCISNSL